MESLHRYDAHHKTRCNARSCASGIRTIRPSSDGNPRRAAHAHRDDTSARVQGGLLPRDRRMARRRGRPHLAAPNQDVLIAAAHAASAGSDDWKIIAALAAATVALIGVLIKLWIDGRRARRERLRMLYAGGWAAVQAYKEMAFAIRRRNHEDRAGE